MSIDSSINTLFFVGTERSGTTVFRLMLEHHPELSVCSEFEYVVDPLAGQDEWPDINAFHAYLRSNWVFQLHDFKIDPTLSYPELAQDFLNQTRQRGQARYTIGTIHRNFDQIERIWPDSRYIHIVRDPRDVARSVIQMGWAGTVWHAVQPWVEVEQMWEQMKAHLPSDRWIEVRYEELIANPKTVLQQVCQFIGVDYSPQMLEYPSHTTYSSPNPRQVSKWQQQLRPQEIMLIEARVGSLLQRRGYQPSDLPIHKPGLPMQLWLEAQNKWGRFQHRMQKFGFWLAINDYISRKLNIQPWQAQLEPQLAAIWRSSLK